MAIAIGILAALFFLALALLLAPRYSRLDERMWRWAYGRYLQSWRWESLRADVLHRDNFTCQDCGEYQGIAYRRHIGNIIETVYVAQPLLQAHHRPGTYRRWLYYALAPLLGLRENLDDLVTLCRDCHAAEHGKEK